MKIEEIKTPNGKLLALYGIHPSAFDTKQPEKRVRYRITAVICERPMMVLVKHGAEAPEREGEVIKHHFGSPSDMRERFATYPNHLAAFEAINAKAEELFL